MVPQKILGANKNLRKSGRALNTSHQLGHEQPGVADFLFQSADSVEPKKNPRYLALTVGRGAGVWPIGGMGLWDGWWFKDSGFQGWILDFIRLLKIFWQERIVRSVVPCPQWRTRYCRFFDWDGNVIPMTSGFFLLRERMKNEIVDFFGCFIALMSSSHHPCIATSEWKAWCHLQDAWNLFDPKGTGQITCPWRLRNWVGGRYCTMVTATAAATRTSTRAATATRMAGVINIKLIMPVILDHDDPHDTVAAGALVGVGQMSSLSWPFQPSGNMWQW